MIPDRLFDVIDATWPAVEMVTAESWTLRRGGGGGKRVSAATANGPVQPADLALAVDPMAQWGQDRLFMIRSGEEAFDQLLASEGYVIVDPVNVYCLSIERLTDVPMPRVTAFCIWEPLSIMNEIWAQGGIGPERLAVMARAKDKTGILAR